MPPEMDLMDLQLRFAAALREPIFGGSRERTKLPPRDGKVSRAFVETAKDLIARSPTLKPVERLELYHRQYWYRLLDSIEEDFPALRLLLGDEAFWRLMEAYLETVPPTSFTLRHLGRSLAQFIAEHPDLVPYPVHAQDMARLEYAVMMAFEAAEHPPVPPFELSHAQMALQPHVHLLALRTPADEIWRRADVGRAPGRLSLPADQPVRFVTVFRHDLEIQVERIPRAAYAILCAISEAYSLDKAMEGVVSDASLARELDTTRVSEWFHTWVGRGWLTSNTGAIRPDGT